MKITKTAIMIMLLMTGFAFAQAIPLQINYQGKVEVNGVPFDGAGQFKFALTNQAGDTYYWTNDGSAPTPPAAPDAAVQLTVKSGQYAVSLGDASLPNMTEVPIAVFNTPGVFLRVWFDDGSTGEQLLVPDRQLTSVPYAYMAEKVGPASITGANLSRESIWPEHEGRSNTIVCKYIYIDEPPSLQLPIGDPVPAGKTFIITDIVFSCRSGPSPLTINIIYGTEIKTILIGFKADTLYTKEIPMQISLKSGLPVPALSQIYVQMSTSGLDSAPLTIAGFEIDNEL